MGGPALKDIMKHEWFEGFDWAALESGAMKAQFLPDCDSVNFENGAEDLDDMFGGGDEAPKDKAVSADESAPFVGYEYNLLPKVEGITEKAADI